MKTRRMWIVIVLILIAGACSTMYTKHYVEGREFNSATRIAAEAAIDATEAVAAAGAEGTAVSAPFTAIATPTDGKSENRMSKAEESDNRAGFVDNTKENALPSGAEKAAAFSEDVPSGRLAADGSAPIADEEPSPIEGTEGTALEAGTLPPASLQDSPAGAAPQAMAPLSGSGEAVLETAVSAQSSVIIAGSGKDKLGISYKTRLEELDSQIERNRAADAEKSIGNSIKARAESELKLWEAELDGIIKALEARLSSEDVEKLYTSQREWQRDRESKALEVSKKQSGSSLEEVEYTVSLADSTRTRAYELLKEYEAVLEE